MGIVAIEAEVGDRGGNRFVVQLLCVVQLVAAGVAAGVKVGDVANVVTNRANHVALHDLHVIDVVQQLEVG